MEPRTSTIQLQNRIQTRETGRQTRRPHTKRRRHTRQERTEVRTATPTKRNIRPGRNNTGRVSGQGRRTQKNPTKNQKDEQIQEIKKALQRGDKEMKKVALGLCQWKDEMLWYQGKIWIPEDEGLRTHLIHENHDTTLAGHGGTAKTTELVSRRYYWPKIRETSNDMSKIATHVKEPRWYDMHLMDYFSQTKHLTDHGNQSQWISSQTYQNRKDTILFSWSLTA
jgi:hypothetical protein